MDAGVNRDYVPLEGVTKPSFWNRHKVSVLLSIVTLSVIINIAFFITFLTFSYYPPIDNTCNNNSPNPTTPTNCQCSYLPNFHLSSLTTGPPCPSSPTPIGPKLPLDVFKGPAFVDCFDKIQQQIEAMKDELNISAISTAIIYDQQIAWSKSFGYANPFKKIVPDEHTIYRIASITKVFTNVMMMKLRDEGKIDLDDPVVKYEPRFQIKNPFNSSRPITFRQLATHLSGMPNEAPCVPPESSCTAEEVYTYLGNLSLVYPQYYRPSYSNLGFAVLGQVLAKAIGQGYEDYMMENILGPLGMTDSGFNFTESVVNHTAIGFYANGTVAPLYNTGYDSPNGQMFSSTADLAKFMHLLFKEGAADNATQLLDSVTVRELLLPSFVFGDGASAWGMPWETVFINGHWVRTKSGGIDGYSSHIAVVPGLKVGMVALTSRDGMDASVLTVPNLYSLLDTFTAALTTMQKAAAVPQNMAAFIGTYKANDSNTFTVTQDYDRLYGTFGYGLQVELLWRGPSSNATFTLKNVGYASSCISKAFAAVDGIAATFSGIDSVNGDHYKYIEFPGFTWRRIVYSWIA